MTSVATAGVSGDLARSRNAQMAQFVCRLLTPSRDRGRSDFAIVCELLWLGSAKEGPQELVVGSSSKFESAEQPYFDLTITNAQRRVLLDGTTASLSCVSA